MSNRLYLTCESHDPPLRAEEASGNHLRDLPAVRAQIENRKEIARIETEDLPCSNRSLEHIAYFLSQHPNCEIGIMDEYDRKHSVEPEPEWVNNAPAVRAWHKRDGRVEYSGRKGVKRIWSPDYRTTDTWSTPSLQNVPWSDLVDVEPLDVVPQDATDS